MINKNPLLLQSANYVYSWFLSKLQRNHIDTFNNLDTVEADETIVNYIKSTSADKVSYENIEARYNELTKEAL